MKRMLYLDHHATTPVDPRVMDRMRPFFTETYGNPASRNHRFGWEAEATVSEARESIAQHLGALPREILFTSGATESINLALKGTVAAKRRMRPDERPEILVTATEHKAVLDTVRSFADVCDVRELSVDETGRVDPDTVAAAMTPRTLMVVVILANNEIGTLNPVAKIGAICRERGVLLFTDASQAVGRIPVDFHALQADLAAFSAHKFYGPKGMGALFVRHGEPPIELVPLMHGGGHEQGLRSGTLNVPGIVGMASALELAVEEMPRETERLRALTNQLEQGLRNELDLVTRNGHSSECLPGSLNLSFAHVEAEAVLMGLVEIALSTGSACTSAELKPSHVLKAIGLPDALVHASIRFGLGRATTETDIDYTIRRVVEEVRRLRELSPSYVAARRDGRCAAVSGASTANCVVV